MESSPQSAQSLAPVLSQMPAYRAVSAPTPVSASRVVAALMQLKDTAAILLLLSDGSLLFGIFLGFGVPGLVLYGLRWRQARGQAGRGAVLTQAILTLLHELFWAYVFQSDKTSTEPMAHDEILTLLYGLGAFLSALQVLITLCASSDADEYAASPLDGQ